MAAARLNGCAEFHQNWSLRSHMAPGARAERIICGPIPGPWAESKGQTAKNAITGTF